MSDRTTLKTFFETGDVPTQAQFADLIDSLLSIEDNKFLGSANSVSELIGVGFSGVADGTFILTTGFYGSGDGGWSLYYLDLSEDKQNHDGGTIIDYDHTVAPGASGWHSAENVGTGCLKLVNPDTVYVEQYGAKGDDVTDDWAAFDAACNRTVGSFDDNEYAGIVRAADKKYRLSKSLNLKKIVTIRGGAANNDNPASHQLHFDNDVQGIVVNRNNTLDDTTVTATTGADGSLIEGISLVGGGTISGHGLRLRARAEVKNVRVSNFPLDNINIVASSGSGGSTEGNANNFKLDNVRVTGAGRHGVFVDGSDANAGVGIKVDACSNGEWGIYDSSFLGNTWLAPHASGNGDGVVGGAYKSDDVNAHCLFFGAYAEGGDQTDTGIDMSQRSICILAEAPVTIKGDGWYFDGAQHKTSSFQLFDRDDDSVDLFRGFADASNRMWHLLSIPSPEGRGVELVYDSTGKKYVIQINSQQRIMLHGDDTTQTFGRASPVTRALQLVSLFVGATSAARQLDYSGSAPTSGQWAKGDIVFHAGLSKGENVGWICTTTGDFGAAPPVFDVFGQAGHRENAGSPAGSIAPKFVGEELLDTTNTIWYKSTGLTNADWVALNA